MVARPRCSAAAAPDTGRLPSKATAKARSAPSPSAFEQTPFAPSAPSTTAARIRPPSTSTTIPDPPSASTPRTRTPSRTSAPASAARSTRKWSRRMRWVISATVPPKRCSATRSQRSRSSTRSIAVLDDGRDVEGQQVNAAHRQPAAAGLVPREALPVEQHHPRARGGEPVRGRGAGRARADDRDVHPLAAYGDRRPRPTVTATGTSSRRSARMMMPLRRAGGSPPGTRGAVVRAMLAHPPPAVAGPPTRTP